MDDEQLYRGESRIKLLLCGAASGWLCGLFWRELFHHLAALWR